MFFEVGDRVQGIGMYDGLRIEGKHGVVIYINSDCSRIGVQFDDFIGGHNCGGRGKPGCCWYVDPTCVVPVDDDVNWASDELDIFLDGFKRVMNK